MQEPLLALIDSQFTPPATTAKRRLPARGSLAKRQCTSEEDVGLSQLLASGHLKVGAKLKCGTKRAFVTADGWLDTESGLIPSLEAWAGPAAWVTTTFEGRLLGEYRSEVAAAARAQVSPKPLPQPISSEDSIKDPPYFPSLEQGDAEAEVEDVDEESSEVQVVERSTERREEKTELSSDWVPRLRTGEFARPAHPRSPTKPSTNHNPSHAQSKPRPRAALPTVKSLQPAPAAAASAPSSGPAPAAPSAPAAVSPPAGVSASPPRGPVVLGSGLSSEHLATLRRCVAGLGGRALAAWEPGTTHLIVEGPRPARTFKYLCAIAAGAWVLRVAWLHDCIKERRWLPELPYECTGDNTTNLPGVPARARTTPRLLANRRILLQPPFHTPTLQGDLENLIRAAGGRVVPHDPADLTICDSNLDAETTLKVLFYQPIAVEASWLIESIAQGRLIDMEGFRLRTPVDDFPLETQHSLAV